MFDGVVSTHADITEKTIRRNTYQKFEDLKYLPNS
jgi:hypothetical protein